MPPLHSEPVSSNADLLQKTEIPWPSYEHMGIIDKTQLEMLFFYDKQPVEVQAQTFKDNGRKFVEIFRALLTNINNEETTQYIMAMLEELLLYKAECAFYFHDVLHSSGGSSDAIKPVMHLLARSNEFIRERAVSVLGTLLSYKPRAGMKLNPDAEGIIDMHLATFLEWIMRQLGGAMGENVILQIALTALQSLVCGDKGRVAFIEVQGLPVITKLLTDASPNSSSSVQLLYQVVFCLWCLSYNKDVATAMADSPSGLIASLVNICKTVPKEKVVRVSCACLRNMLDCGDANNLMVKADIMKVLASLHNRKWADEDIVADIEFLMESLQVNMAKLSSFEVYEKEVMSQKLDWTPSHKNVHFWTNNIHAFEKDDCALLNTLVDIVKHPDDHDATTLAVACFDLGEFVKYSPDGRKILAGLQAKGPIMALMQHENLEVQKNALNCVQKLMVINWEYLNQTK